MTTANLRKTIWQRTRIMCLAFFLLGLVLFLPFLSINYDLNSVHEAASVEIAGSALFDHNHLLYRPVGALAYRSLQTYTGYNGPSLPILQIITALFSSLGLSTSFIAFAQISKSIRQASLATIGMAVSWSYWRFSTDAYYVTVALPFVAIAVSAFLLMRAGTARSVYWAFASGLAITGAILFWQANVFLLIGLLIGYLILPPKRPTTTSMPPLALYIFGTPILAVALVYAIVGTRFFGTTTPAAFLSWLFGHGGSALPLWGAWEIDRVPAALQTMMASTIPIWEGLGLRNLLRGDFNPTKAPGQASLLACCALFLGTVVLILRFGRKRDGERHLLSWLILSYCVYLPFIVWWDPYEPKWFVIPNFFFWALVALCWGKTHYLSTGSSLIPLALIISIIAFANFTQTIWPNHSRPNELLSRAECVNQHMAPGDRLLATDWSWAGYLPYFYQRSVSSLIRGDLPGLEAQLVFVQQLVDEAQQAGGRVVMMDIANHTPEHFSWLETNAGVDPELFSRINTTPRCVCDGVQFVEIQAVD